MEPLVKSRRPKACRCEGGCSGRRLLRHVSLMALLVMYTCAGAKIFQVLEHEDDVRHVQNITSHLIRARLYLLLRLTTGVNVSEEILHYNVSGLRGSTSRLFNLTSEEAQKIQDASKELTRYERVVEDSLAEGISPITHTQETNNAARWIFSQSLFFAITVLTTIGYGNIAPSTIYGRIFCIFFALIGIPLMLSAVADMGEILASLVPTSVIKRVLPRGKMRAVITVLGTLCTLLVFISVGGGLFVWTEQTWSFMEAFYFCFITTTTIGFGDLVPQNSSLLTCIIYIILGMALTSTVIELVRRQYASSWAQMKVLSSRIHALSVPLAEAMRKIAESELSRSDGDAKLVEELHALNVAIAEVASEEEVTTQEEEEENDPWALLLDLAQKKRRITVVMYETCV